MFILLFSLTTASIFLLNKNPQVTVQQGILKGRTALDKNGRIYYSFQGIPYAKPPLNELRFKAPQAPEPWEGVRTAKQERSICPQITEADTGIIGDEDCLYLNVYTPKLPQTSRGNNRDDALLPVIVWIHGGSYAVGSGNEVHFGPQNLVSKDVVVVTINYRLGILGFLAFEDSSLGIPGNAGLKDQVAALKWVKRNIRAFGGDPDNITLGGESAGASSVHLHMLSPMSRGLFKRAVLHSGAALAFWAFNDDKTFGHKIAADLGYNNVTTDKDVLNVLMSYSQYDLVNTNADYRKIISPVIEIPNKEFLEEHFLTKHPEVIIREKSYNNVSFIIGHTSFETVHYQQGFIENPKAFLKTTEEVEEFVFKNPKINKIKLKKIAQKIFDHYYGKQEPSLIKWMAALSDFKFVYPIHKTLKLMLNYTQPIYFYKFTLDSDLNKNKKIWNATLPGAAHGDDMGYLFHYIYSPELTPGSKATLGVERMTTLWTNFVKTGNPQGNPPITRWPTVQPNITNFDYLEIGDELIVKQNQDVANIKFWEDLCNEDTGNTEYIIELLENL